MTRPTNPAATHHRRAQGSSTQHISCVDGRSTIARDRSARPSARLLGQPIGNADIELVPPGLRPHVIERSAPDLSVGSAAPIARAPTFVSDRQDGDVLFRRDVGDVVRERADRHSTHLERLVDSLDQSAGERPPRQMINRSIDSSEKGNCLAEKANPRCHSVRVSDSRCRTAIQSWLVASPARALRARSSISFAH